MRRAAVTMMAVVKTAVPAVIMTTVRKITATAMTRLMMTKITATVTAKGTQAISTDIITCTEHPAAAMMKNFQKKRRSGLDGRS